MQSRPRGEPTQDQIQYAVTEGTRAAVFGIVVSALLAMVKISAGLLGRSYALVADGIESVLDLFSAILVLAGLRASAAPQTGQYPYGRGKAEPLAAVAVATLLLVAAGGIAVQAVREIVTPHATPAPFTLFVLVGVVAVKELLYRFLVRKGKEINSRLLETDAWHHRSDGLTSLAAFVGISVALLAGEGYESADDWAALFACAIIAYNGVRLLRTSLREVLDVAAPREIEDRIRTVAMAIGEVLGVDLVRARRSGLVFLVDIHVEVDPELSVRTGHRIAHDVKDALINSDLPILDALVHVEPRS
jgi:cation diffusion facilitator family transporter